MRLRALKIAASLILILLLSFFLVGFLTPELHYQATVIIDSPLAKSFSLFNDNERISEWLPDVLELTPLEETPNKVGSRYRMVVVNQQDTMTIEETLLQFETNKLVELEFKAGWMHKINHFDFYPTQYGTRIDAQYTIKGQNMIARSMFLLFQSSFQEMDQQSLNQFKLFVEKQHEPN